MGHHHHAYAVPAASEPAPTAQGADPHAAAPHVWPHGDYPDGLRRAEHPEEVSRIAEVGHAAHSLAHGHHVDPVVTSAPATGQDLRDIQDAVIAERAATRAPAAPPGTRELGSRGVRFDEEAVPARGAAPNYPPRDGAAGEIATTQPQRGSTLSRYGSDHGEYFAEGTPSLESRALPPTYGADGTRTMPDSYSEFEVTGDFPAEVSTARRAFAHEGGATQLRTAMSAEDLHGAGLIRPNWQQRPCTPEETAEVEAAVREVEGPHAPAPEVPTLREPISSDMATMVEDIQRAQAADAAATTAARTPTAPVVEAPPPSSAATAAELGELGEGASAMTRLGRGLGAVGAVGGAIQTGQGIAELAHGDIDNGVVDTTAGAIGTGVGAAATGLLGDAAAAAVAAPPVAIGAAAIGLASAGHHYNAEHDTWGDATTNPDGSTHHLTSVDFAVANAHDAYDQAHDSVAGRLADSHGHVSRGGELVAGAAGLGFGGLMGLGAGLVGFGGDLVGGVEATGHAAHDLWSHWIH